MDEYWKQALQLLPDEYFAPAANAYTVLNIWQHRQNGTSRFERTSIENTLLREWSRTSAKGSDHSDSQLVFQSLIVSTNDYNDWPVDISREDLAFVAQSLGVPTVHVPLLFVPYTHHATLDRQVSWYYGRSGLRALAATDTVKNSTRAIITIEASSQPAFEEDLSRFSSLAGHPLMLALAIRAGTMRDCEKHMQIHIKSLRETERHTGFHAEYEDDSDIHSMTGNSMSQLMDLGRLSKKIGNDAANLGNFRILLARFVPLKEILQANDILKWRKHFGVQTVQDYDRQSEEIMEMDAIFESMKQGLLESMVEYQGRARSLQSVIFNLIAKKDADANISLAKESRAIAVATRNDGTSMKTIAIMTMIFLPATFYAALFAIPTLQWQESPVVQKKFWIYWAFTIPSTIIVLLTWYVIVARQVEKERIDADDENKYTSPSSASRHRVIDSIFRSVTRTTSRSQAGFRQRLAAKAQQDPSKPHKEGSNMHVTGLACDDDASPAYHMT